MFRVPQPLEKRPRALSDSRVRLLWASGLRWGEPRRGPELLLQVVPGSSVVQTRWDGRGGRGDRGRAQRERPAKLTSRWCAVVRCVVRRAVGVGGQTAPVAAPQAPPGGAATSRAAGCSGEVRRCVPGHGEISELHPARFRELVVVVVVRAPLLPFAPPQQPAHATAQCVVPAAVGVRLELPSPPQVVHRLYPAIVSHCTRPIRPIEKASGVFCVGLRARAFLHMCQDVAGLHVCHDRRHSSGRAEILLSRHLQPVVLRSRQRLVGFRKEHADPGGEPLLALQSLIPAARGLVLLGRCGGSIAVRAARVVVVQPVLDLGLPLEERPFRVRAVQELSIEREEEVLVIVRSRPYAVQRGVVRPGAVGGFAPQKPLRPRGDLDSTRP